MAKLSEAEGIMEKKNFIISLSSVFLSLLSILAKS